MKVDDKVTSVENVDNFKVTDSLSGREVITSNKVSWGASRRSSNIFKNPSDFKLVAPQIYTSYVSITLRFKLISN